MPDYDMTISNKVIYRNNFGRFEAIMDKAQTQTVRDLVKEGAAESRRLAPSGSKPDPRTPKLRNSIRFRMTGKGSGEWYSTARHAGPQETGSRDHTISGSPHLAFWWEKAGRRFVPAEVYYRQPGMITTVSHPGNPARPFLRPAYEMVVKRLMNIARRNYSG